MKRPRPVLDIGCGEGYYTHAFADALPEITTFGLDVSKIAISGGETLSAGHFLCRFQPPFAVFRYQYGRHNTYLRAV